MNDSIFAQQLKKSFNKGIATGKQEIIDKAYKWFINKYPEEDVEIFINYLKN